MNAVHDNFGIVLDGSCINDTIDTPNGVTDCHNRKSAGCKESHALHNLHKVYSGEIKAVDSTWLWYSN